VIKKGTRISTPKGKLGVLIPGMGAVTSLLFPEVPSFVFSLVFTIVLMYMIIQFSYQKLAQILKWMCMVLLLYLIVPFLADTDWQEVLRDAFIPEIHFNKQYISILVAILGTTISPYLFFWQTSMEAEEMMHRKKHIVVDKVMLLDMKKDVNVGMLFSILVMYFIVLTAGTVLFKGGIHQIDTVEQAAQALKPLAGV